MILLCSICILVIHSSVDGDLDCLRVLATVHSAIVDIGVQVSIRYPVFIPLNIYPEEEMLDHMEVLF